MALCSKLPLWSWISITASAEGNRQMPCAAQDTGEDTLQGVNDGQEWGG